MLIRVIGAPTVLPEYEIDCGGSPLPCLEVRTRAQAAVLARLALTPGKPIAVEKLFDAVPFTSQDQHRNVDSKRTCIRDRIRELRLLPPLKEAIVCRGRGLDLAYELRAGVDVDYVLLQTRVPQAERALARGETSGALSLLLPLLAVIQGFSISALFELRRGESVDDTPSLLRRMYVTTAQAAHAEDREEVLLESVERLANLALQEDAGAWREVTTILDLHQPAHTTVGMVLQRAVHDDSSLADELPPELKALLPVARASRVAEVRGPSDTRDTDIFAYQDLGDMVRHLVERLAEWSPDAIAGINRGGAILGGLLAKQLGHPWMTSVRVSAVEDSRALTAELCGGLEPPPQRILLVDEAFRFGGHSLAAVQALGAAFPQAEIRYAVLVEMLHAIPGGGDQRAEVRPPDYSVLSTDRSNFTMPWDAPKKPRRDSPATGRES